MEERMGVDHVGQIHEIVDRGDPEAEMVDAGCTVGGAVAVLTDEMEPNVSEHDLEERGRWAADDAPAQPLVERAADLQVLDGEGDVVVLLTDDTTIRDLNARFRDKDRATNVLSFPAAESAAPHLGDLVLAFGTCADEARAQGKSLADHVSHLTVHGVLHLLGWDHDDEREAECMEQLEREILATMGIADPYQG